MTLYKESDMDYPYSEAERLWNYQVIQTDIVKRIDSNFGPDQHIKNWFRSPDASEFKRPERPRAYYKRLARRIIYELTWSTEEWQQPDKNLIPLGHEWMLEKLYYLKEGGYRFKSGREYIFLMAIAKDAGVWPAPKWWRVKRRLQAANKFSTHHSD